MMGKVTFTNSLGDSIELLSIDSDYILNSIEGLDADAEIQTQKSPNADGGIVTDVKIAMREIQLGFTVTGQNPSDISEKRSYAGQVFNPSLGEGILVYEIDLNMSYSIKCIASNLPQYPTGRGQRGLDFQRADITLLAPNPFWMDEVERTTSLYAFQEGFSFPFQFPVEFGTQGTSQTIYNTGHQPAPFDIEVSGPNTTPRITNLTTGQFMEFNRSLSVDEKLVIRTKKGEKYARIVNENGDVSNAMPFMTLNSEFFSLRIGANEISYNAAAGSGVSVATITWTQLYNSI